MKAPETRRTIYFAVSAIGIVRSHIIDCRPCSPTCAEHGFRCEIRGPNWPKQSESVDGVKRNLLSPIIKAPRYYVTEHY